jgi:acetyl-CoA carboxylase carboxyl transferase subunit alpha
MEEKKDFYRLEREIVTLKEKMDKILASEDADNAQKIAGLKAQIKKEWAKITPHLSPFHIVQIARHPKRPYTLDYIDFLAKDFLELHGDRRSGDDTAIVAGMGFYKGKAAAFIGHQKGRTTRQRIKRNFGQPNPEGYRKAWRVMKLAEKFRFPIITLIDTPGAYPGVQAEEKGQAAAIAYNLKEIAKLRVPVINVVIGEGGSGGALGIGVGDRILMLEHAFYSVISPEGCAAILWKDQAAVDKAAENLRFLAKDLLDFGIIDKIIPEPPGGAHVDYEETFKNVDQHLVPALQELEKLTPEERIEMRYQKFRRIGAYKEK